MKSRRQDNIEYKRFGIQEMTGKETGKSICWSIYH